MSRNSEEDTVQIEVPARPEFVRIVRLVMAGVGNSLHLDLEEIEDLKLAVGEACHTVLQGGGRPARLRVSSRLVPGRLAVEVSRPHRDGEAVPGDGAEDGIGFVLMKHLMDEVDLVRHPGETRIRMVKQLP